MAMGIQPTMTSFRRTPSIYMVLLLTIGLSVLVSAKEDPNTCSSGTISAEDGTCTAQPPQPAAAATAAPLPECNLYLAASTIPGAGLGIFTAIEKNAGDILGRGDVSIPVLDANWHNEGHHFNPFSDYYWAGHVMGMDREVASDDSEAYCPGLDCAINCNLALINTQKSIPEYSTAGLHRSRDPGVGAFTPYHNGTTYASRHINAGGELFKFYGDNWFTTRPSIFGDDFPLSDDYPAAEELLETLVSLPIPDEKSKTNALNDVYDLVLLVKSFFPSRTMSAMPDSLKDALYAADHGELAVLHEPNATRSLEWLAQNGRCIDHIGPGYSTLPQAGHGAFAVRDLPADTVITTSPLHHIPFQDFVNMYHSQFNEDIDQWERHIDNVIGHQVLLNYCYGHPETSLLLCPYGNGINYINHNQTQANVKIRWARDFDLGHNADALEHPVEDLEWNYKPQVAFDYIALRDIKEGDELFLDYGNDWENAWQDHVDDYEPAGDKADSYVAGVYLNEKHADMPIRTVEEQEFDPYPEHLQIRCHSFLRLGVGDDTEFKWRTKDYGLPCRVVDRYLEDNALWYTVELEIHPDEDEDEEEVLWIEKTDVPRGAIQFFDRPGESDMHLENAFRHAIGIPDDMIPDIWRNL